MSKEEVFNKCASYMIGIPFHLHISVSLFLSCFEGEFGIIQAHYKLLDDKLLIKLFSFDCKERW